MTTSNSLAAWIIPTLEITTIHRDNEPSIHVEHFFNIQELEKVALKLNETLLFCGARHFFNKPKTIYPKLIETYWRNTEFVNKKTIASKVLGVKVVLSSDTIAKATGCLRQGSTYQGRWEKNYNSHVTRAFYQKC